MVYHFLLADSVDPRHLVIESDEGKRRSTTVHRWEENPANMVSELIRRDLEASGLFEKAVDQWSSSRYRYALEGTIRSLHGVVRDGKARILVEVEAGLIDFEAPLGSEKTVMRKTYRIEAPAVDNGSASVARAVNLAIKRLSERVRSDIRESLNRSGDSGYERDEPKIPESSIRVSLGNTRNESKSETIRRVPVSFELLCASC